MTYEEIASDPALVITYRTQFRGAPVESRFYPEHYARVQHARWLRDQIMWPDPESARVSPGALLSPRRTRRARFFLPS